MKQKAAVQISGYLRTINDCIDSWSNVLDYDKYGYDFFFFILIKINGLSKGLLLLYDIHLNTPMKYFWNEISKKLRHNTYRTLERHWVSSISIKKNNIYDQC